eukprot:TRINITY_DN65185_c0_g1_i1.p1 TRINITY_DN65185_c0_g1~~TRINITY_DN65185_c0_g1_i1.p1  ORF type:complete len:191 (-),score=4.29 TRINITY_DN65185_c0_g1_i1:87-659(-)
MKFFSGGSIATCIRRFGPLPLALVKKFTRHILEAVEFLHQNQIIHRDIKGGNVLIDEHGDCYLGDLSACRIARTQKANQFASTLSATQSVEGSLAWMAPEILQYRVGRRSDIWSVACVVLEMITGGCPWPELSALPYSEAIKLLTSTTASPPIPETADSDCRAFLHACLQRNSASRPYAEDLLRHPFLLT